MSAFSVKKPFTIFVSVLLVVVLGFVSLSRMTPDLLPEMDLPYVILFTPYYGASPETVEEEVSRPLESQLMAVSGVESVSSTSAENYSMVQLQVSASANMDALKIDIQAAVNSLSAGWSESVGVPTIMELSPDVIPTVVSAVSYEGKDQLELSAFTNDVLLTKLDGIEGVAGIITSGVVTRSAVITIVPEKLDALNQRLYDAITEEFYKQTGELEDAKKQLEEGQEEIDSGKAELESGKQELEEGKTKAEDALSSAERQLNAKKQELTALKAQLAETEAELNTALAQVQEGRELLTQAQSAIAALEAAKALLDRTIASIENNPLLSAERKAELIREIKEGDSYRQVIEGLAEIDARLAEQGLTRADIPAKLEELDAAEQQINEGLEQVHAAQEQVQAGLEQIDAAYGTLRGEKNKAEAQLKDAENKIKEGEDALAAAQVQLDAGREQLSEAEKLADRELQKALDAINLKKLLDLKTVATLIGAQNFNMPAGYIQGEDGSIMVSVGDELNGLEELSGLVLTDSGLESVGVIMLTDLCDITVEDNASMGFARINDGDGVLVSFTKQSGSATATTAENIQKRFDELELLYPGLRFIPLLDQGAYIDLAIGTVGENLLLGAALAIIILLVFLRDLRPTFIVACSIPASVLFALVLMYFTGVTLNLFSMAGLAVGVGMLVDNSIVVIENIYRLRALGVPVREAAVKGAKEVAAAVTASTLTTICVFAPILFIQGLTRELFEDMALTITFSLVASLAIALTLVPAMVTGLLKKPVKPESARRKKLMDGIERLIKRVLSRRVLCLVIALALLVGFGWLSINQGFSYLPDGGGMQVALTVVPAEEVEYESLLGTAELVHEKISDIEGLSDVGTMVSSGLASVIGLSSMSSESNQITCYGIIDEDAGMKYSEITREMQARLSELGEEYRVSVLGTSTLDFESMMGGGDIALNIYSDEISSLPEAAKAASLRLEGVEGIDYVESTLSEGVPALHISVDKNAAARNNLTVAQVYMAVATKLTGEAKVTTIKEGGSGMEVRLVSGESKALTRAELEGMTIDATAMDGSTKEVALADIASFEDTASLSAITRIGQRRYTSVTAYVREGYNITKVNAEAVKALEGLELEGVSFEFVGESETIFSALEDLLWMLLMGVLLIYLIMVAQFQSLKLPFIVMFTVPLAFTGGFVGLLIGGMELSIVAMVGMIMLVGVVVNNGIVLIDCIERLRSEGVPKREAIVQSVQLRLRPVLMTAVTTILGLLPLAVGMGVGAEMIQPVAVVCIGGLVYATATTLVIIPAAYDLVGGKDKETNLPG